MPYERPDQLVNHYLEDAVAAERSSEARLRALARTADDPAARQLFSEHAEETRTQCERLETRLAEIAAVRGVSDTTAPAAATDSADSVLDLIEAYAAENTEIAMYEALAVAAMAAGDSVTEQLARRIQEEERIAADNVWRLIGPAARRAVDSPDSKAA